jgi:hypothetical protein
MTLMYSKDKSEHIIKANRIFIPQLAVAKPGYSLLSHLEPRPCQSPVFMKISQLAVKRGRIH